MTSISQPSHRRIIIILSVIVVFMFGFSFALVPLYTVFCKVTGLNGKVDINNPENSQGLARYKLEGYKDLGRIVAVEFDVNRNRDLNCEIIPQHSALMVPIGELTHTSYYVKNLTSKTLVIQAIPSISPGIAAKHLKKLECFCFNKQVLKPNEALHLPLRFWLSTEIPEDIKRLTLSYTLFDVTNS